MTAQEEFDKTYITSSEICKVAGIGRLKVMNDKRKGKLPDPIDINGQITVWRREDVLPYLRSYGVEARED